MVARTSNSRRGNGAGWAAVVAGVGSVAALPIAIYLTRFSESYELLHSAVAIPVAAVLGLLALALAGRGRRHVALTLGGSRGRPARAGRLLGIAGLCLAASALVALGVYCLLEYVGSRD